MKRILAWFLALIMVFGLVTLPKMTKAEDVPELPEHGLEGNQPAGEPEEEPAVLRGEAKGGEEVVEPEAPAAKEEVKPTSVDKGEFTLYHGWAGHDTKTLESTFDNPSWETDSNGIVSVADGVVTALAAGEDVVVAKDADDNEEYWTVTVIEYVQATGLTLNKTEVTLSEGQEVELTATATPAGANAPITWSSSNDEIATVDQNGKVTAVAESETAAVITATTADGQSATCTVTVIQRHVTKCGWNGTYDHAAPGCSWLGRNVEMTVNLYADGYGTSTPNYFYNCECVWIVSGTNDPENPTPTDVITVTEHTARNGQDSVLVTMNELGTAYLFVKPADATNWDGSYAHATFKVVDPQSCSFTFTPKLKYMQKGSTGSQSLTVKVTYVDADGNTGTAIITDAEKVRRVSGDSASILSTKQGDDWKITASNNTGVTTFEFYVPNAPEGNNTFKATYKVRVVDDLSKWATGINLDPSPAAIWTDLDQTTVDLSVVLQPNSAENGGKVTSWTSSNTDIVTVDAVAGGPKLDFGGGTLDPVIGSLAATATKVGPLGSSRITAVSEEGYTATATVSVLDATTFAYVQNFEPPTTAMTVGQEKTIKPTMDGLSNGLALGSPFQFSTDNGHIVGFKTPSKDTVLVAYAPGTATITVSYAGRVLSEFTVTVLSGNENLGVHGDESALFESDINVLDDGRLVASLPNTYEWTADHYPILLDEDYKDYIFFGYAKDEDGTEILSTRNGAFAVFVPPTMFRIGIQFRLWPIDETVDPDKYTDVRFITTIPEDTDAEPKTFQKVGFLIKVGNDTIADDSFAKPFYKTVRGDYDELPLDRFCNASKRFALETVTGWPNETYLTEAGTTLSVNAFLITLDGTTVSGPVKYIRIYMDADGNKLTEQGMPAK